MRTRIYPVESAESDAAGNYDTICPRPGVAPANPGATVGNEAFDVLVKCAAAPNVEGSDSWVPFGFGNVIETHVNAGEITEAGATQEKVNKDAQDYFDSVALIQLACDSETSQSISSASFGGISAFTVMYSGGMWFSEPLLVSDRWKVNQRYSAP